MSTNHYYNSKDLDKFADIRKLNPQLGEKFFDYYHSCFKEGALTSREKSLMALAIAHALKCPYCIDAYTKTSIEKGANEEHISEAIHVASAMAAGISLVHGVQTMNHLEDLSI